MTPVEYKHERERRGSQQAVAARLGVDYRTVQRREAGTIAVTHEAELAIRALSVAGRGGRCKTTRKNTENHQRIQT